jgi:DNA-binding response OmpR family regulator
VVDDDEHERKSITELFAHSDVAITTAGTGAEAWELMHDRAFDCVVLGSPAARHERLRIVGKGQKDSSLSHLAIIVFTGKDLSTEEELTLRSMAKSIVSERCAIS